MDILESIHLPYGLWNRSAIVYSVEMREGFAFAFFVVTFQWNIHVFMYFFIVSSCCIEVLVYLVKGALIISPLHVYIRLLLCLLMLLLNKSLKNLMFSFFNLWKRIPPKPNHLLHVTHQTFGLILLKK